MIILVSCQSSPERIELAKDYYNVGNAYFDLEQYDKAVDYYNRALQLDPTINQAVFNLARTSIETGDYQKSLKLLSRLQESDPENIMVLEMVAYAYYKMDLYDKSVQIYQRILDINLNSKKTLYNISVLEKERGNSSIARSYLKRLQGLEDNPEYRILLAELAVDDGDPDEAISLYESILVDEKGTRKIYTSLKDLYLGKEQYFDAVEMFELLVKSPKDNKEKSELYFDLSRVEFLYLEEMVSAQEHLIEALKAGYGRNDPAALDELADQVDPVIRDQVKKIVDENILEPEEGGEE